MLKLIVATRNRGKLAEIRSILADLPYSILEMGEVEFYNEVEETGDTFLENSLIKAKTIARLTGYFTIADDSGLEVAFLGGKPGVHSARYAGPQSTDEENYEKLLRELTGVPREKRRAAFRCVMVLAAPSGRWVASVGSCHGEIASQPRGNYGFGYDPVFFVPDFNRTMAEIPPEEKNRISHRARALAKMKTLIDDFIKEER